MIMTESEPWEPCRSVCSRVMRTRRVSVFQSRYSRHGTSVRSRVSLRCCTAYRYIKYVVISILVCRICTLNTNGGKTSDISRLPSYLPQSSHASTLAHCRRSHNHITHLLLMSHAHCCHHHNHRYTVVSTVTSTLLSLPQPQCCHNQTDTVVVTPTINTHTHCYHSSTITMLLPPLPQPHPHRCLPHHTIFTTATSTLLSSSQPHQHCCHHNYT